MRVKVQTFELADFLFDLALEVLSAQEKERYAAEQSRRQQRSTASTSAGVYVLE